MCRRSCLPGVYLSVGKLADIPFRDVNFLRYFGCSNICFLGFLISLVNFRLTWRIVAPTRQHANTPTRQHANTPTRQHGEKSLESSVIFQKRIEREIRSHYFCNTSHYHEHYKFLRLDPQYFLRLLAACGNISNFLRLDFQFLAFRMFLRVNCKNLALSLLARACVFLRRKNFLRHFLRVHYF